MSDVFVFLFVVVVLFFVVVGTHWMRYAWETRRRLDRLVRILDFPDQGPWVQKLVAEAQNRTKGDPRNGLVDLAKYGWLVVKSSTVLDRNVRLCHGRFIMAGSPIFLIPPDASGVAVVGNIFFSLEAAIQEDRPLQDLTPVIVRSRPIKMEDTPKGETRPPTRRRPRSTRGANASSA